MPDDTKYRLYWYPGTCARIPFVALEEIGCPYDIILEDRMAASPSYLEINPKGAVPALAVDGKIITENPAIQIYLARRHPTADLLPLGDAATEATVVEMQSWFASTVHPLVRQLRVPQWYSETPATHAPLRTNAMTKLQRVFSLLETRLEEREWLFDSWSLLDVYLLWLWFRATGSGLDGSAYPLCASHAIRCEARPSVARVLEQEQEQFSRLRRDGKVPDWVRDFQCGFAPRFND